MRWVPRVRLPHRKAAFAPWAALWLILQCSTLAAAQAPPLADQRHLAPIVLDDGSSPLRDLPPAGEWTDQGGKATLAQVLAGQARFGPFQPDRIHALGAGALWIQLRLVRPAGSQMEWVAEIPLPPVDSVTLYQQDARGAWRAQAAGDKLAVESWPEPGRFPVFRLDVPAGETRDVYFRVQHDARSSIPLRIASAANHGQRMQLAYLALGLVFGGLSLLIAACLAQSLVYRDRAFFGYAAYATIIALAVAAYTGAAGHLLWPRSGFIADAAQGGLALLSAAAAILFVRDLSGIATRAPRLAAISRWTALGVPLLLVTYLLLDRPTGTLLLGAYLALACGLNLVVAWRSWRGGDKISAWILAAYLPLAAAVVLTLMRILGMAPASWANQYGLVAAMAIQVPLLLVALSLHSRERHGATIRELALSSQDALTGVLAAHLFHDRLRQLVARHRRDGESAAVLFIDVANYSRIKGDHGSALAEQSLVRSVIKLRRPLREIDTLSRIGEARFGLILEGMGSRVTVTDRAARVVAAGMMPIKGQPPEIHLEFHVAAALLGELNLDAPALTVALAALLDSMSQHTRRPIRFVGAQRQESAVHGDSAPFGQDSGLPLSAGPAPA